MSKKPIRILSIDGGGVGGIIPARVLARLQEHDPRVIANADLVAGTSTGGLIALGLAAGLTPDTLCKLYLEQAKDIFAKKYRRCVVLRLFRSKFVSTGLRSAVRSLVGDKTLGELQAKPVLVPVTALRRADSSHNPAGIFLSTAFRLYGDPRQNPAYERYGSSGWKCEDVALATAAAPSYFPAHTVKDPRFPDKSWLCWDGGIVANNPAMAAYAEIMRLDLISRKLEVRSGPQDVPDVRILSLGTGFRDMNIPAGDWGQATAVRGVLAALLDTSVGSTDFLLKQLLGPRILRLSPTLEKDYAIDDPQVVDGLNGLTNEFCDERLGLAQPARPLKRDLKQWLEEHWF